MSNGLELAVATRYQCRQRKRPKLGKPDQVEPVELRCSERNVWTLPAPPPGGRDILGPFCYLRRISTASVSDLPERMALAARSWPSYADLQPADFASSSVARESDSRSWIVGSSFRAEALFAVSASLPIRSATLSAFEGAHPSTFAPMIQNRSDGASRPAWASSHPRLLAALIWDMARNIGAGAARVSEAPSRTSSGMNPSPS